MEEGGRAGRLRAASAGNAKSVFGWAEHQEVGSFCGSVQDYRKYLERMWREIRKGASFFFAFAPMELFNATDLNLLSPVEYGSVMAERQRYDHYQGEIEARGLSPAFQLRQAAAG